MGKSNTGTKITFYMTLAVLAGFATILIMNAAALLGVIPSRYISPNDVRGIAVRHGVIRGAGLAGTVGNIVKVEILFVRRALKIHKRCVVVWMRTKRWESNAIALCNTVTNFFFARIRMLQQLGCCTRRTRHRTGCMTRLNR